MDTGEVLYTKVMSQSKGATLNAPRDCISVRIISMQSFWSIGNEPAMALNMRNSGPGRVNLTFCQQQQCVIIASILERMT
jgi:hypothetical protein